MDLHVFNPEHEIALAYNRKSITAPHNVQEFRMNLGWIPALWAKDGDVVLVDDAKYAIKAALKMKEYAADVLFLEKEDLRGMLFDCVRPWGWNRSLCTALQKAGVKSAVMPNDEQLDAIRMISGRQQVQDILPIFRIGIENETCGECLYIDSAQFLDNNNSITCRGGSCARPPIRRENEPMQNIGRTQGSPLQDTLKDYIEKYGKIVVKAPWSCSGRGVRYISDADDAVTMRWVENVISQQGGIMIEPYYNKVTDFGMEFEAVGGKVEFCGLSIFQTVNGAYKGNILASEEEKQEEITRYIATNILDIIKSRICDYMSSLTKGVYDGPFGVDMMIVAKADGQGFLLHPCVEINLRRTMGHVALALSKDEDKPKRLMQTVHNVNYQLKISELENNFVQII